MGSWVGHLFVLKRLTSSAYPSQDADTPDLTVGLDIRFDAIDLEPGVTLNELVGEGALVITPT